MRHKTHRTRAATPNGSRGAQVHPVAEAHHRNGSGFAEGFDVVLFDHDGRRMLGILFDQNQCAVLDVDLLARGNIAFGDNSHDGGYFEGALRQAVAGMRAEQDAKMDALRPEILALFEHREAGLR